jgi:hypothetical protein
MMMMMNEYDIYYLLFTGLRWQGVSCPAFALAWLPLGIGEHTPNIYVVVKKNINIS